MTSVLSENDAKRFKVLARRLKDGKIFVEDGEYRGEASDGVEVTFGGVGFEPEIERYLRAHPGPMYW